MVKKYCHLKNERVLNPGKPASPVNRLLLKLSVMGMVFCNYNTRDLKFTTECSPPNIEKKRERESYTREDDMQENAATLFRTFTLRDNFLSTWYCWLPLF